jgi:hypothetical protein
MGKTPLVLLVTCISAVSFADGPHAKMKNGSYPDHARAWDKFAIQTVKLGTPLDNHAGFTCGPPPGTDGFSTQNHSCVKFLDARCKGKTTKIKNIRVSGDVPPGQGCFMAEFEGSTYLDRRPTETPLSAIRIIATDTSAPLVQQIEYTFAADDLTDDSNLGKALIAKYGPPTSKNSPIQMQWQMGDVVLRASCRGTVGPTGEYCRLTVEDQTLDRTERDIQQQADDADKRKHAPAAPSL